MERFYSVLAEMDDGTTHVIPARGDGGGQVFQQVKSMPGVRRVGKVTEISRADHADLERRVAGGEVVRAAPRRVRAPAPHPGASPHADANARHPERREELAPGDRVGIGNSISGPRIVMQARQTGGEQPFRHLKAPPDRPKPKAPPSPPPVAPPPSMPAASAPPQPPAPPISEFDASEGASSEAAPLGREYRIVKSRRQSGQPYLLQRGHWDQVKGKRTFAVEWEKGFDVREAAEKHQDWIIAHEREAAEIAE